MKKTYSLLFAILFVLSSFAQTTVVENFDWDGINRSYRLRVPPASSSGDLLPLVINMHGFAGSASQQESSTGMNAVADTAGFFVAYPNGTFTFLFLRGWATELDGPAVDDIGFISAMIDTLVANYPIDPNKVYACGFSNGGGMTSTLACAIPDKIRAFGINAAAILPENGPLCNPSVVRPMLSFHGTSDFIVPYGGGPGLVPAEGFFKAWVNQDNCSSPVFEDLPDVAPGDGTTVKRVRFDNCLSGNKHWFYRIVNGGHTWPGSAGATQDIDADVELWAFFRENGAAARISRATIQHEIKLSPNPASTYSLLQGLKGFWQMEMYDYSGKVVSRMQGSEPATHIDCSQLPSGLYLVLVRDEEGTKTSKLFIE